MTQRRRFNDFFGGLIALAVLGTGLAAAPPAVAVQAELRDAYVALGDSYASGNGAGEYDPASGDCHRSALAYPKVWAAKHPTIPTSTYACSGATTDNVLHQGMPDEQQLKNSLSEATMASVMIGGNDIGFAAAITKCLLGTDQACTAYINDVVRAAIETDLPAKLDRVYKQVRDLAPSASVQVVGYPHLFSDGDSCTKNKWSTAKRNALNNASDLLATTIETRAKKAGFSYRDTRPVFNGHGVCGTDPWIHNFAEGTHVWEFFHPTASGHAAIATLLPAPTPALYGGYVTVRNTFDPLSAKSTDLSYGEKFTLERNPDATVSLFAEGNWRYVTAPADGNLPLVANRSTVGETEKFSLTHNIDGSYSLKAVANDRYVTTRNDDDASLIASSTTIGAAEKFALIHNIDDTYTLQTLNNRECISIDSDSATCSLWGPVRDTA